MSFEMDVAKIVNKIGKKSNPKFVYVKTEGRNKFFHKIIKIRCLSDGLEKNTCLNEIKRKKNPFFKKGFSPDVLSSKVNKVGNKSNPRFIFVKDTGKKVGHNRMVLIQNVETKQKKVMDLGNLLRGSNPWNKSQDRHELNVVHPKIKGFLNKVKLKIDQEVKLSKRSRVDFVCSNKFGKKILIEVKSDKKRHSRKKLKKQITRYETDGRKKFGKNYLKTYLVSLNGTYGYSLKELKLILKQDKFL